MSCATSSPQPSSSLSVSSQRWSFARSSSLVRLFTQLCVRRGKAHGPLFVVAESELTTSSASARLRTLATSPSSRTAVLVFTVCGGLLAFFWTVSMQILAPDVKLGVFAPTSCVHLLSNSVKRRAADRECPLSILVSTPCSSTSATLSFSCPTSLSVWPTPRESSGRRRSSPSGLGTL